MTCPSLVGLDVKLRVFPELYQVRNAKRCNMYDFIVKRHKGISLDPGAWLGALPRVLVPVARSVNWRLRVDGVHPRDDPRRRLLPCYLARIFHVNVSTAACRTLDPRSGTYGKGAPGCSLGGVVSRCRQRDAFISVKHRGDWRFARIRRNAGRSRALGQSTPNPIQDLVRETQT